MLRIVRSTRGSLRRRRRSKHQIAAHRHHRAEDRNRLRECMVESSWAKMRRTGNARKRRSSSRPAFPSSWMRNIGLHLKG